MDKILDLIHKHKGKLGIFLVFIAGGLAATDHHKAADAVLTLGTLLKVGWLPDGPSPKVEPNAPNS